MRIRDASDVLAAVLKDFLGDPAGEALIVIEAGDLGRRRAFAGSSKPRQRGGLALLPR